MPVSEKRLAEDLRDNEVAAVYTEDPFREVLAGEVLTYYGHVRKGFEYPMLKFVVLTETDIFGKEHKKKKRKLYQGQKINDFNAVHFTNELLDEIKQRGAKIVNVTLHVGAGTWMPVKTENLSEHKMHSEWCCITSAQADIINNAKRVIAVGTTSMRLLESAAMRNGDTTKYCRVAPFCATTDIFITPGYQFRAVDVLLTNFHLPKSTLFMLVSAFAGLPQMKSAYSHAVAERYRFFSYGDCCLLFKKGYSQ